MSFFKKGLYSFLNLIIFNLISIDKINKKQTYFNTNWLQFEEFKTWLKPDSSDKRKFVCKTCNSKYTF